MKRSIFTTLIALFTVVISLQAEQSVGMESFDFTQKRDAGENRYRFTTEYLNYAPNGSLNSKEVTSVDVSVRIDDQGKQTLTCLRFTITDADGKQTEIPRLAGWEHIMDATAEEVLGVPHSDFSNLKNSEEVMLTPDIEYRVYNTFVDFYAFNNIFAEPHDVPTQKSIGDLTTVGQTIEHYSSYSEPSVHLGEVIKKGSYFKNGRVTLWWDGVSQIDGKRCALVGFDSGESSFKMNMEPVPDMNIRVEGGSHYWGDLYINQNDLWIERVTFKELVITEMIVGENPPQAAVIKRIGIVERMN